MASAWRWIFKIVQSNQLKCVSWIILVLDWAMMTIYRSWGSYIRGNLGQYIGCWYHSSLIASPGHQLWWYGMCTIYGFLFLCRQVLTTRAPSQYTKRRLFVRSRKVSKPRDLYLELSDRSEIWQALRQHCCRCACQISKWYDSLKYQSRGFETSRDLTKRRIFGYWDGALHPFSVATSSGNTDLFLCFIKQVQQKGIRLHFTMLYSFWNCIKVRIPFMKITTPYIILRRRVAYTLRNSTNCNLNWLHHEDNI